MDNEATVLDGVTPGLLREGAMKPGEQKAGTRESHTVGKKPPPSKEPRTSEPLATVGGDDAFILAWGRSSAAVRSKGIQLLVSMVVNVALAGAVVFLAWRNEQKEPLVFVRDKLGNVIQADAGSFLHAGDARSEPEIKGFVRRWVLDAFTWTPLDVEDRLKACLQLVDGKAQAVAKAGLRLAERQQLVDRGTSGRVYDDSSAGREPQTVIARRSPLEVMVSFDHYLIDRGGRQTDAGHYFVRALLKQVPRSNVNPNGFMIVDIQVSQNL